MENQISTKCFDINLFKQISNPKVNYRNKPFGGFWTSTKIDNNSSTWIKWCETEMPHWIPNIIYEYSVDKSAKILSVTNIRKYIISNRDPWFNDCNDCLDFEAIVSDGYDGINFNYADVGRYYSMFHAWDCESTVFFNPKILTFVKEIIL